MATITQLSARIARYLSKGLISEDISIRANMAIRENLMYGNRMTPEYREIILTNRFGIKDDSLNGGAL